MDAELRAACAAAVHVIRPNGDTIRAGRAVVYIFEGLGWWWMAPLRLPPLSWAMELGYRLMANNRPFFARFMFRVDHDRELQAGAGDESG